MVPSDAHQYEATMSSAVGQLGGGKEPVQRRNYRVVNDVESELHFPVCFTESSHVCAICLFEIGASDPSRKTTCKHEFHADCIIKWWTKERGKVLNCPVCRESQKVSSHKAKQVRKDVEQAESFRKTPSWLQSQSRPPLQRQKEVYATWASYFKLLPPALRRPLERIHREGNATETPSREASQMSNTQAVQHYTSE